MKHFDDSAKKLIKNVAALCVSALILIAATVAWFSYAKSASAGAFTGTIASQQTTEYFALPETAILYNVTTVGTGTANEHQEFVIQDTSGTAVSNAMQNQAESSSWTKTSAWGISSLYPGVYRAYKMEEKGSSVKPSFHMSVTCANDDNNHTALRSTYLEARAYSVTTTTSGGNTTTTYTQVGAICDSLYNLLLVVDENSGTSSVGTSIDAVLSDTPAEGGFIVVIDIGVPGTDVSSTHSTLRTLGASISLSNVSRSTTL